MRLKRAALCVAVAIVGSPVSAVAQSAGTLMERYVKAIGGKQAVEAIVSSEVSGSVETADGRSGVFTQRTRRPQLFSVNLTFNGSRWRTGFNGRSAWQDDDVDGLRTLYGPAASRVRAEAVYASTRLVMSEKTNRVFVSGHDEVRGRKAIVAVVITPDGTRRKLFFDAESYLLVKDEQQTASGVEERFFDDYRPVDSVMEPHRVEWRRNGETLAITVEQITHNTVLDDQLFDVPDVPAAPPVDVDALLSAAGRIEERAESVRSAYAYTQTMTVGFIDGDGRLKQNEGSTLEVFHLGGRPVARLIKNPGGQPLSEAARRREDQRVSRIVREYEQRRRSGQEGHPTAGELGPSYSIRGLWGTLVLQVPVMTTGWLPAYRRVGEFINVRREPVRGRAFVVMEFRPRSGVRPNGDVERQAVRMAGTLWIDEATQTVTRIDSYFLDDYESVVQGSSVWIEQTFVNDELWLPSRVETNLRRSLNFGALVELIAAVRFADYKKFSVETDSTLTLPDAGR
jgi:hypothetical protein